MIGSRCCSSDFEHFFPSFSWSSSSSLDIKYGLNSLTTLAGVGLDADFSFNLLCSPFTLIPSSMSSSILRLRVHLRSHGLCSAVLLLSECGISSALYAALTGGDGNEKRGLCDRLVSIGVWRPGTVKSIGDWGRSANSSTATFGMDSVSVMISVFGTIRSGIMAVGTAIGGKYDGYNS